MFPTRDLNQYKLYKRSIVDYKSNVRFYRENLNFLTILNLSLFIAILQASPLTILFHSSFKYFEPNTNAKILFTKSIPFI